MNANDQEMDFLRKVKDLLNDTVEDLDDRTKQWLEQVRIEALRSAAEKPSGFFPRLRWIMAGGFATAAMAAALFFYMHTSPGILPPRNIEDFEIITSVENIDFYQNLDFYRWLASRGNGVPSKEVNHHG